jgi:hypothetical protein
MPDLAQAAFAEEQKLAARRAEPKAGAGYSLVLDLATSGIPIHTATLIAIEFSKLEARIAELEKAAAPPHVRKQEKRG